MKKSVFQEIRDRVSRQMDRLEDPNNDLEKEVKRAQALGQAAGVMINTCKVQLDLARFVAEQKGAGRKRLPAAAGKKGRKTKTIPLTAVSKNDKKTGNGK